MTARAPIDTSAVDDAIRHVLAVEAAGEASVREAAERAEALAEAARAGARAIAARAERRIRAMRHRFEAHTALTVAKLEAADREGDAGGTAAPIDGDLLGRAVRAVAAELTGGGR